VTILNDLVRFCILVLVFRAAAMTLRTVLLSLQALLAAAEPDDPQDAVVARQYKENLEIFHKTARHWSSIYAGGK
jgi:ubiquitin-conjugating enzyme (huntingtin interacting protein 2)